MELTKTDKIFGLLDYSCRSRQSGIDSSNSYQVALKNIIEVYSNKAIRDNYPSEVIKDFNEQLSCVNYLDNVSLYPGISNLVAYSKQLTKSKEQEKNFQKVV